MVKPFELTIFVRLRGDGMKIYYVGTRNDYSYHTSELLTDCNKYRICMEYIDLSDYENFQPEFDLSSLNLLTLKAIGILSQDIKDVCLNPKTKWANLEGFSPEQYFFKLIGFSRLNNRPLLVNLSYQENRITVRRVEIANEDDIEKDYCGQ